MTEKTYSAKDLSGRDVDIDRTFSESEVDMFSDLFSDFWEENGDNYTDNGGMDAIDIAYSEFFDAYSCGEYSDKKLGKNVGRGLAALAGAGAGYAASNVLNAKDKQKRKDILLKMKQGRASSAEINELKSLKTKINTRKALSTVGGAALATAGTVGLSKLKQKQNKKEMESNYSQEDLFADEFANYFVTNVDHYGDTDEGMDEAYNDFVNSMENETEEVYSEEDEMLMDNFSNFYNDVADLYSNDDQGIEDAFNDFLEIEASMDNYTEDYEINEDEYSEDELAFIDYYTSNEDVYGDKAELAYNDFMEVYSEVENEFEDEYAITDTWRGRGAIGGGATTAAAGAVLGAGTNAARRMILNKKKGEKLSKGLGKSTLKGAGAGALVGGAAGAGLGYTAGKALDKGNYSDYEYSGYGDYAGETFYSEEVQAMAHDFADFYAELEDVYGDDLEMAFDDYSDALENLANEEDVYSEDNYAMQMPKMGKKAKSGLAGAGMGAAAGIAMGAMMDPKAKERKALKAKVKAGTATDADKSKLAELKKARRNRIMKAGGAGAVGGAALGVASETKKGKELRNKVAGSKFGQGVGNATNKTKETFGKAAGSIKGMFNKKGKDEDAGKTSNLKESKESYLNETDMDRNFSANDGSETKSYVLGLLK